ncbi:MAG: dynamin family protein, partial [Clostridium sp.]|nr:dynamin family protein [Clostridium sp.]
MEVKDRILYSSKEYINRVENVLDQFNGFRYDRKYKQLLGEHFTTMLSSWNQTIRERKNDAFTIVVVGDFKRGKSSFINALLGQEVVTTNVTTETVTLNTISYGEQSNKASLAGGRCIQLTDGELCRSQLEEIIKQAGEPITELEIKRPIELLKDIHIVDTPGTSDTLHNFDEKVAEHLLQADAVIYLCSVNYPLSLSEQLFIKTVILPQKYTEVFLIGNFADILGDKKSYLRMEEFLNERVKNLLPHKKCLLVSALDEICRIEGKERPCPKLEGYLEGNFDQFRESLVKIVNDKKETVIPDRMQRLLL